MPKIQPDDAPAYDTADAASAFAGGLGAYRGRAIGAAAGLERLGANLETLMPGSASSHRHWHDMTDELVVVLKGQLVLCEDAGETLLRAGDIAAFPAGVANGHCLQNRSAAPAEYLVVGSRHKDDRCHYADIDLVLHPGGRLTRRDGSPAAPKT